MNWIAVIAFIAGISALLLSGWRLLDRWLDSRAWRGLVTAGGAPSGVFDPASIDGLPEPARRYFLYTIRPGTPLQRVVELDMEGELGLGTKDQPNYRPMVAHQVLAPPHGLVWRVKTRLLAGSDGVTPASSWTRFWLLGIVPVIRAGKNKNHRRSAFGRVVAEGAFWVPASLLPGERVKWETPGENVARAIVTFAEFVQVIDITVAENGQPMQVAMQRWSNENPEKVFRRQPFGGYLSEFREFEGYRLPTLVEGGNYIGTADYFPFFRAKVTAVRFPQKGHEQ